MSIRHSLMVLFIFTALLFSAFADEAGELPNAFMEKLLAGKVDI